MLAVEHQRRGAFGESFSRTRAPLTAPRHAVCVLAHTTGSTCKTQAPQQSGSCSLKEDALPESATRKRLTLPVFGSFVGFRPQSIPRDLLAGLTVWAVLIPEGMAYATIAGVPPVVGLYAAIPALVLYAIFGTSRQLIVAATSGTALLSASIVGSLSRGDPSQFIALSSALAIVTGVLGIIVGLARLGFLATLISASVLKGFVVGMSLIIIVGQLSTMMGVTGISGDFFQRLFHDISSIPDANLTTVIVGCVSLVLLLALKRWLPLLPGALIVSGLAILAATLFNLEASGVAVVGQVPTGLPSMGLPVGLDVHDYVSLVWPAAGVLLVGFTEALGAVRAFTKPGADPVSTNRELFAMGASNLGAGFGSGIVVNGSLSKTAVNAGAHSKSQIAGLAAAAATVLTLLFLAGLFHNLPLSTLSAVVIVAVIGLVDFKSIMALWRVWTRDMGHVYGWAARADFLGAMASLLGTLIINPMWGLIIGVLASLAILIYRGSRPRITRMVRTPEGFWYGADAFPDVAVQPKYLVIRIDSQIFFGNSEFLHSEILGMVDSDTKVVIISASASPTIDLAGTQMLVELHEHLAGLGVRLLIAHAIGQAREILTLPSATGGSPIRVYTRIDDAIAFCEENTVEDGFSSPTG